MSIKLFHSQNKSGGILSLANMNIVCDGNSLTEGAFSTNPGTDSYPAKLLTISPLNGSGVTSVNKGVGGQTTQNMIDDATTDIDVLYESGNTSLLIAWEVGNDIYYNGSVSSAITRFWNYCDARRAVGWKVIVITCPARDQSTAFGDNSAAYNVKLADANTALLSGWASHADGIVDVASDSRFIGYNLTYYYTDKIHYTDAGYLAVANLVRDKIVSML